MMSFEFGKRNESREQERVEAFVNLRKAVRLSGEQKLRNRIENNPEPTEQEVLQGCFVESLDPQIRQVVVSLYEKGYTTQSGGFAGRDDEQYLLGRFTLDEKVISLLQLKGVEVSESVGGMTRLCFVSREPSLSKITKQWHGVCELLPHRDEPAQPSSSTQALMFRDVYAPEAKDLQQHALRLRITRGELRGDEFVGLYRKVLDKGGRSTKDVLSENLISDPDGPESMLAKRWLRYIDDPEHRVTYH